MPNIMELCLSPQLGGLELFVKHCSTNFSETAEVTTVSDPRGKLHSYLPEKNRVLLKRSKLFPWIPARKLAGIIDKKEIDTLHFHWTRDMPLAVLAKLFSRRKPTLVQSRHMGMTRFKDDPYHRFLYRQIDKIHTVTHEVEEQIHRFIPSEICPQTRTIYPGTEKHTLPDPRQLANLRKAYSLEEEDFVIGIIGRIEEGKGQSLLIDAVKKLYGRKHNIKLLIVGHTMDRAYLDRLREKVSETGLREAVIFTGFTQKVNLHIHLCDTVVLATEWETFGLVLIEAMMQGIAVAATGRGGPEEIIVDGESGLLFHRDSEDIAEKISLFFNREFRENIASNGQKRALEKFEEKKQFRKLLDFLTV